MRLDTETLKRISGMTLESQTMELKAMMASDGWKVYQKLGQRYIDSLKLRCDGVNEAGFTAYKNRILGLQEMLDYADGVIENWDKKDEVHEY